MSAPGSIIKIKRSPNVGSPATLAQGEMAYSYAAGGYNLLGDRLFIGTGTESGGGDAANHSAIGGLYYTRLIDASAPGTLTTNANSIPVLNSSGTIDKWYAGNTYIYDNVITTTATNGNLSLNPNGTGMVKIADTWTLPRSAGTNNYILKTNGSDTATWAEPKTYIGSTAVDLFNSSGDVSTITDLNLNGGNYSGNYVKVSDIGFGPVIGTTNSDSGVRIETGASGSVGHTWKFNANGSTTFNSAYTFPAADASTAGYILKSNGAGELSWVSPTAEQLQSDWTQADTNAKDYIKNKPMLATVATSGLYSDLSGTPMLAAVATSGSYTDLSDTPMLATVATSGLYSDLSGTPSLATVATSGLYSDLSGTPMLASVATSGSYIDLSDTPMLATVATSGSYTDLSNTPMLAAVATSGDYNDLINKPDTAAYLNLSADSGSSNVSLITDTIDFVGTNGINTAVVKVGTTVSVTTSLSAGGITNASLANSNVTIGSTTVNLGQTVTAFAGLTSLQVGNIKLYSDNQITTQETNGNINLRANGTGVIDVGNTRITSVSDPTQPYDAATKHYVDAVASGLHVHSPAKVAVSGTLATLTGGTVTYNNGTAGVGATLTLQNAITTIDSMTFGTEFTSGDRILIKDQVAALQNGVYTISANGKVLTRATDFDSSASVNGGDFIFVVEGTNYGSTGWVQTTDTVSIGTDPLVFSQFAGAGTYLAGQGLYLDGQTFNANVNSTSGGIEIVSNQIQLKSSVAGNGLSYSSGVITVTGTAGRISVSSTGVDIDSTYVGQSTITTLGTITTGTWNATTIGTGYGGTGLTTYTAGDILYASATNTLASLAKGTDGQLLTMVSGVPAWQNLDGGTY